MSHPRIVTENMLDNWIRENSSKGQGVTVELVWRLASASCPAPTHRRFPMSDSMGQHGSDGELDTVVGYPPFVPKGRIFWEIGAGVNAHAKANSDYHDLTAAIPQNVRQSASFVFVTPLSGRRDWENTWKDDGIASWVEERRKRGDWADIHVLNGASLIDWLYRFPAVERWLAGVLGQKIEFIETVDARWETLRMIGSPPPLSHELFTGNRTGAAQKTREIVIDRTGSQLKLDTKHPAQGADFVSALISSLPEDQRIEAIGRCLILTHEEAWSGVCSLNDSHVLVADFDLETERGSKFIQAALNRRHAVIFAGMPGGIPHANRAPLLLPDEYQIKSALEKSGYPPERARRLSNACRSDLNALLRCIQGLSATPEWAQRTDAAEIAIAMLISSWNDGLPGDRAVVESIVGKGYGEWIVKVREFTNLAATPLQFRNGYWHMTSRYESWQLLGKWLCDDDLDRFKSIAISLLREKDPKFELPPEEHFVAAMHGKAYGHSNRLRKGIAETLALLGTFPNALTLCSEGRAEGTALIAVRKILSDADGDVWASLNDVLPLLAEAAPNEFLVAVESAINSENEPFAKVFAQERSGISGRTFITGLLWGLENLAWSSDHIVTVCRILAQLAANDPGGNWSNRPSNSLTTILLPWLPQTCATTEKRHAAMRVVVREQPDIGWKLLLSLLPHGHSHSSGTHKPIWRPFIPEGWKDGVSKSQYWEDVLSYAEMAIEMAGSDPDRIVKLVDRYFRFPIVIRETLRQKLTSDEILALKEADRFRLWTALTTLTTNHRKFADHDNWKVPEGTLEELDTIADRLRPTAPEIRHKRLFGGADFDLYDQVGDWKEQQKRLELQRQEAVREIVAEGGLALLLKFAAEVEASWRVGFSFGSLSDTAQDSDILPSLLETESKPLLQFASGYEWGRHKSGVWNWVDSVKTVDWSAKTKGQFFVFLPFCEETWTRVQNLMGSEEGEYWRKTSANPYESASGIEMALGKLIDYERADAAIQCMHLMEKKSLSPKLIFRALNSLSTNHHIDAHAIGELITFLQQAASVDEQSLRTMEWKFLPILGEFHNGQPISLTRWMAEKPDFFCTVIQTIFRSTKDEEKVEASEELKERAANASRLLSEWCMPPGARRDGSFDPSALISWVEAVKAKCIESGHWEIAAEQIGKVLFYAPREENGLWIGPVCNVLESKDHEGLRRGLTTEIFNSRGVFTFTHGKEELQLAEEWEKKASLAEDKGFSRLGQELRRLANSYRRDAEREAKSNPFEST